MKLKSVADGKLTVTVFVGIWVVFGLYLGCIWCFFDLMDDEFLEVQLLGWDWTVIGD